MEEQHEIDIINADIAQKEIEKNKCFEKLKQLNELPEEDKEKTIQIESTNRRIEQLDSEIEKCNLQIQLHKDNIVNNSFFDADTFHERFGSMTILTEEDENAYKTNKNRVGQLVDYVKSDEGIKVMREAVERATSQFALPDSFPESEALNMGRVEAISITKEENSSDSPESPASLENQEERSGCLFWFKSLFKKNQPKEVDADVTSQQDMTGSYNPEPIEIEIKKSINEELGKAVIAIKKADDVRNWWQHLCDMIDKDLSRLKECRLLMDGEKDVNGEYIKGKEGYHPKDNRKSVSLIDMDRVRLFRDTDVYYKNIISKFLDRWFDKSIELDKRMTMPELIKHQVLDSLVGKYHTLLWDGSNPFVKEDITDEEMHDYIEHDLRQSRPFVEYVRILEDNLVSNLNIGFFSNNQNLPSEYTQFKNKFCISTESLSPFYLKDFVNSLCVVQVMDIPDHVDALKDFKPTRETPLSRLRTDIQAEVTSIVGDAYSVEEKARAIYNWICENIAYDTTKQIHDAETCYKTKRGVCQAYCELFCYMAEVVGVTAEIITGITKNSEGEISADKHSWIFVYTHAYDGLFIDPTWGAGAVDGVRFVKNEDNSIWFNVSPYWLIFSHFPDSQYWTKLDIEVTEEQFKKLPFVKMTNEPDVKNRLFECISNAE